MPQHGTRGMGPIADAGLLPQTKQYRSTSVNNLASQVARIDVEPALDLSSFIFPASMSLAAATQHIIRLFQYLTR